jgi:hypothetical protein
MTKFSVDQGRSTERSARPSVDDLLPPAQRTGAVCELYAPGHQIHYSHQGDAVRSPARTVLTALIDGDRVMLVLDGGEELVWRHHDPERLRRILELLRGKCVVYPAHHALRVGPYWFNCAAEADGWQDCRVTDLPRRA